MSDTKVFLKVYEYQMYPTKEQKLLLDKEFYFYKRYRKSLYKYMKQAEVEKGIFTKKEALREIRRYQKRIANINFDYSKYCAKNHFDFACDNYARKYEPIFSRKRNFKRNDATRTHETIKFTPSFIKIEDSFFHIHDVRIKIRPKVIVSPKFSCCYVKKFNGKYFLTCIAFHRPYVYQNKNLVCGIDLGLKHFITLSDNEGKSKIYDVDYSKIHVNLIKAKHYCRIKDNIMLKNPNYKKSKNFHKVATLASVRVAKAQEIRTSQYNKIADEICRKYDYICLETLDLETMYANPNQKTKLAQVALHSFYQIIKNKAKKYNKELIFADRYFPSSQICSNCGAIHKEMNQVDTQSETKLTCECGTTIDRDLNASRNLLKYALDRLKIEAKPILTQNSNVETFLNV